MRRLTESVAGRALACLTITALLGAGCTLQPAPDPRPGLPEFELAAVLAVPGGLYNIAGRNLLVARRDVSVDGRVLSGFAAEATYNSATRRWHWAFDTRYDGSAFVDPEGTVFDVSEISDGRAIPGTWWVKLDASRVKTKGGLVFEFDAEGRLARQYWSSDPYPRIEYLRGASMLEVRECPTASVPVAECRLVFTIELGAAGPVRVTDEENAKVGVVRDAAFTYTTSGLLETAKTPFERDEGLAGTRYEYDASGLLEAVVNSEGERIEYDWLFGWLWRIRRVGESDPPHYFSYPAQDATDPSVYSVTHTNPLGGRTRYTFTAAGHVLSIERIDAGELSTIDWDPALNRPTQIVGFDGTATRFEEWADDDPSVVREASGNIVSTTYRPDGIDREVPYRRPLERVTDSVGLILEIRYDASGRPEAWENGEGEAATRTYYPGGMPASVQTAWGATAEIVSYGVHGHWQQAEFSAAPDQTVRRRFDRVGNLRIAGPGVQLGGVLEQAHDLDRRLTRIDVAAADDVGAVSTTGAVSMERRSDGQLLAVSRPYGGDHQMEYDALGRISELRERVDGDWVETTYRYDGDDNVTSIEHPNGTSETMAYDVYGRLIERKLLRDGVVDAHAQFQYQAGRLDRWYDSVRDQWEIILYDGAGRPREIVYSALGESLRLEYDLRSRVTRKRFAVGSLVREIGIEWDLADRRRRVFTQDPQGLEQDLVRLDYEQGRLAAIDYGNGLRRENLFGATGRFEGYRTTDLATGALVEETSLSEAKQFNPPRLEVVSRTETALAITEEVYWLSPGGDIDTLDGRVGARLFRWQASTRVGGVLQDQDARLYAWDELSNLVDDPEGDTFLYNAERNRLLSATVDGAMHSYTYDASGYTTSRNGLEFGWSAGGQLERIGPAASPLAEVVWDTAGRPVNVTAFGEERSFGLFGGQVEYDANTATIGWLHLAHVSLPFAGDARSYRHFDALGNVGVVTNELGEVTSHRRYSPFGIDRVYGEDSLSGGEPRGFVGGIELRHEGLSTGLVLLGARVLDSETGRFLSQDPVFQHVNAYAYASGNPVRYEDASGLITVAKAEVAAAALDVKAAQAELSAAKADSIAAGIVATTAVATGVASLAPSLAGRVSAGSIIAVGGALAAIAHWTAEGFRGDAATHAMQAAQIRLAIKAAQSAHDKIDSYRDSNTGGTKQIELYIDISGALPLAPPSVAPSPCGPQSRGDPRGPSALVTMHLLALVLALSLSQGVRRRRSSTKGWRSVGSRSGG